MDILTTSIRIIDYQNNKVYTKATPESFDEYINELIAHINSNTAVRDYKTKSVDTEVISCIKQILVNRNDDLITKEKIDTIANRLLEKEVEAQKRVAHMNTNVQKGSLIQALMYDNTHGIFTYLLAKVEHSSFVDDMDFTFKSGFSKDKKTIWKSCLFDLPLTNPNEYYAKIYVNNIAKYWSDDFLELEELINDESNTLSAFKAIEGVLNKNLKTSAPKDHIIIRNSIISYFKNNEHFDYNQMLEVVLGQYQTTDLTTERLSALKDKLSELPETKKFDRQFLSIPSVINARIKKVFEVNDGIQIRITDEVPDIENTITAYRTDDGTKYIKIKTNNNSTFEHFAIKNL